MFGPVYRFASLEWRKSQWLELHDNYPELWYERLFFWTDDNCIGNEEGRKVTIQFLEWIIAEKLQPPKGFMCQMTVVDANDTELVALFAAAGCTLVCAGVETDNPETLREFNKPQSPDQIMIGLNNLHNAGIRVLAMTMAGADTDTRASVKASIRRLRKQGNITFLMVSALVAFPGTRMRWNLVREGRWLTPSLDNHSGLKVAVEPKNKKKMTRFEVWLAVWENMAWFYLWTRHGRGLIWTNKKIAAKMIGLSIWQTVKGPYLMLAERFMSR